MTDSHSRAFSRRRFAGAALGVALMLGAAMVAPVTAQAAPNITGKLRDLTNGVPVAGQTIRLRANEGGVPGEILQSVVTNSVGDFAVTPPFAARKYFLQLVAGDYQGGYLGHDSQSFVRLGEEPQLWDPGTDLGSVHAYPAFMRGTVVNAATGQRVRGVVVTARDVVTLEVLEQDTTNSNGVFVMTGLNRDEYAVKLNGSSVGYETGFLGCAHGVVPAWGDACSYGTGKIGKARLDHL